MIYITQPTYFPWTGYFSYIKKSETLVFLDDVQFARRSWQQRNRIYCPINDYKYLTVSVKKRGLYYQKICETELIDGKELVSHIKLIKSVYSKSNFFYKYYPHIESIYSKISNIKNLSKLNIFIIKKILDILNIKKKILLSSSLNINGNKSEKMINIMKYLNEDTLMINAGSKNYVLNDLELFKNNNIKIECFDFMSPEYNQFGKKFIKNLSILDALFHEGENTIKLLDEGLVKLKI